jgi:hypothetical protein
MKQTWKRQREASNTSTAFIVWEGVLRKGIPASELEPTVTYRLGVDKGSDLEGNLLGGKILPEWSQLLLGEARGDKW